MKISIPLKSKCIETSLKREYNKRLSALLRSGPHDERLEMEIDVLKSALESFDFPGLRAGYKELSSGDPEARVELVESGGKNLWLEVNYKRVSGCNPTP